MDIDLVRDCQVLAFSLTFSYARLQRLLPYVAQTGLTSMAIFLPQPPGCWDDGVGTQDIRHHIKPPRSISNFHASMSLCCRKRQLKMAGHSLLGKAVQVSRAALHILCYKLYKQLPGSCPRSASLETAPMWAQRLLRTLTPDRCYC